MTPQSKRITICPVVPVPVLGGFFSGMRTKTHRRFDAVLPALGLVLTGGSAAVGAFGGRRRAGDGAVGRRPDRDDGDARTVEVIDYDFGSERRHGIFRDVPELPPDADVVVRSATPPKRRATSSRPTRGRRHDRRRLQGHQGRHRVDAMLTDLTSPPSPAGSTPWAMSSSSWRPPA